MALRTVKTATVQVVAGLEEAAVLLEPTRLRLVRELAQPDSAVGLAQRLGLPRQRVNYHLRQLEAAGFLRLVEERRKRNCVERVLQATARAYVISPEVLAELGGDPETVRDQFSWSYLVALASRAIRELAIIRRRADRAKKKVATFALESQIRFSSAEKMHAFVEELAGEVARLVAKHHDDGTRDGRVFRFLVGAYPAITKGDEESKVKRRKSKVRT
jgi:DNA-binding transcriptional ArsR family regulator